VTTIKKKHNIKLNDKFINQYSSVIRYTYNRIIKDNVTSLSELENIVKTKMLNIDELDASWIKTAVKKAVELNSTRIATTKAKEKERLDKEKLDKKTPIKKSLKPKKPRRAIEFIRDKKVYFGGRGNFFKRKYNKIDELDKSIPFDMVGSCSDKNGNRKAELNVINDNEIIFKPKSGIKQSIKLKLSKNEFKLLSRLELECKENKKYFNIKLDKENVYISFDESRLKQEKKSQIKNRILGIDLNPNWIGYSIQDFKKQSIMIYKNIISLEKLNKLSTEKKNHEIYEIVKHIIHECIHYQVNMVGIEKLSINSKEYNKGRKYNKLLNNDWNRNDFVNNLTKWLNINNIKTITVNPAYTSFMGQIDNPNDYDSVAASLEIGHRTFLVSRGVSIKDYINDRKINNDEMQSTRWKKMVVDQLFGTYIDLYKFFKKKKFLSSYRFLFHDNGFSLRMNSIKSGVVFYNV